MQDQPTSQPSPFKALLDQVFLEHPRQAGETYWQHFKFTISMSCRLGFCCVALLIHGLVPSLCVHTTSNKLKKANAILRARADKTMEATQDSNWII